MIFKLDHYGIKGLRLTWPKSYLTERKNYISQMLQPSEQIYAQEKQ